MDYMFILNITIWIIFMLCILADTIDVFYLQKRALKKDKKKRLKNKKIQHSISNM
ncbi:hypothetical protein CCUN_0459 [Campylobacter cuniculorum DSM 23162 = LMG 24588]|uniref:Uncharacterized protein n=1 Tax=Campylobacter cuniculorum DSM 23162 = LMG 24588 TaxID=1121267 RepID=A0A1W6BVG6_9BACT|nr:hypothetical protein CCUN_0459 [Campylobacter cuniculorum DSM 23162 = LMG 24588]